MRRQRVLWITDEPPDRTLGGGSIRQSYLLEALASEFPTDVLTAGVTLDQRTRELAANVTEIPRRSAPWTDHPVGRRALSLAITLGSPHPSPLYATRALRRDLAREIGGGRGRYELVCVEHEALAPLLPPARGERWIITLHHLLSGMIASELALAPGRRQRWFRERELRKARALEQRAVDGYDRCIVCSDEDAAALRAIAGERSRERIAVIPNGVDLALLTPTPLPGRPTVLLPGHLAYPPNIDGAVWFCSEVWPEVRAALPHATLMLVGRAPVEQVRELARSPGVEVHADVPSMRPYFDAARVVVVPLRVGTGTRLKALEAMAAGRAVVGTPVGLGGIGVVDGVQALVAEAAGALAAAVIQALQRDELAKSLAAAGRAHVENRFGWDRIGAQFVAIVSDVLDEAACTRASKSAA